MTDPLTLLAVAGGPIAKFTTWITLRIRVVAVVRRRMKKRGVTIDSQRLHRILYAPEFTKRLANPTQEERLALDAELQSVFRTSDGDTAQVDDLRKELLSALRSRLRGSTPASDFTDERQDARTALILDSLQDAATDETLFEHRLATMHPLRASDLRAIRLEWPRAARVLGALADSEDRDALLRRWSEYSGTLLSDAPAELFGVLADISADSVRADDSSSIEARFVRAALAKDIEPRGYWKLRAIGHEGLDLDSATEALQDVRGYPLVEAALHEHGAAPAIQLLEEWRGPTPREELYRRLMLAEMCLKMLRLDDAIALAHSTYDDYKSTGGALLAAKCYSYRHMVDASVLSRDDLPNALSLTVTARSLRRKWGLDSGDALALEFRIRRMLSDHQGVLDLASGEGDLPATASELHHREVVVELAKIHAERGDLEVSKRLLSEVEATRRPQVAALIAEREGRAEAAVIHWAEAIESSADFGEKADLALQLALHGVRSPFVDELVPDNPTIADEITLIAALFSHRPGAVEEFRLFANAAYKGALFYYIYLKTEGDSEEAARFARESAQRWGDADLWLESAQYLTDVGRYDDALADIRGALATAPTTWGGKRRAYRLLVETASGSGDWLAARDAAAQLVAGELENPSAVWALIACQVHLNDLPGAFRAWQNGGAPEPGDEMQVGAWIELFGTFGAQIGTPRDALRISNRFAQHEPIRRALLGVLFMRPNSLDAAAELDQDSDIGPEEESPDPDREAFRAMLADYLHDFPDGAIRSVPVDLDDVLGSVQAAMGDAPDTSEMDEHIATGAYPVGVAGELHGKTYLEALIARDAGPVFAGTTDIARDQEAMEIAHAVGAVVDLSALVTIARLPSAVRAQLAGHFGNARVLVEQHRDAATARVRVDRASEMSIRPGQNGTAPTVDILSSEQLAERRRIAATVEASFSNYANDSHARASSFREPDQPDVDWVFLLAADLAKESELPLWADDRALCDIARAAGARAFSTPELLHHMRSHSAASPELIDLAEATLIADGYSGFRFDPAVWSLAWSLAASPLGMINAITYAGTDQISQRAEFALGLADEHAVEPTVLAGFIHALAQWLLHISPTEETATTNMGIFAKQVLRRPWVSSSSLPYCVAAFRGAHGQTDAAAVLLRGVYGSYETLAAQTDPQTAATYYFELVSRLDAADGLRVRSAIVSGDFE